jgi:hypothetical protein
VELTDFDSSYVFDMAQLFHPHLYNGCFIDKNCELVEISDSDLVSVATVALLPSLEELRTRHSELIKAAIWKKIRELAIVAGRDIDQRRRAVVSQPSSQSSSASPVLPSQVTILLTQSPPSAKRRRSMTSAMGLGSPDSVGESKSLQRPRFTPTSASIAEMVACRRSTPLILDIRISCRTIRWSKTNIQRSCRHIRG